MTYEGNSAAQRKNEFLDAILEAETRVSGDPFTETTRTRQKYLLLSSILTLVFTYSMFELKKLTLGVAEGDAHISSAHFACIFGVVTLYLVFLFLVGSIQELGLKKLQRRHFEKEVAALEGLSQVMYLQSKRLADQRMKLTLASIRLGPRALEAQKKRDEIREQMNSVLEHIARRRAEGEPDESMTALRAKNNLLYQQFTEQNRVFADVMMEEGFPEETPSLSDPVGETQTAKTSLEDEIGEAKDLESAVQLKLKAARAVSSRARKYAFYRAVAEMVLPTLLGLSSVVLCFRHTDCLTSIVHAVRTAF